MTRVDLAVLGSDGTVGGPGGSGLTPSVGNASSAIAYPETYGAVGDGVTDDTTALQSWLASGSKRLALSPGKTYLHRHALTMNTANQVLDGNGSTLKRAAQATTTTTTTISSGVTTQITVASAAGFQVGDQIVVEQGGNFDQTARTISSIVGNVITITGTFGIGLSGTTNVRTGWSQLFVRGNNCRVTNTVFDGNVSGWSWARFWHTTAIYAGDNVNPFPGTMIDHNQIINQPGDGIAPTGLTGCVVAFNDIETINGRGISWSGNTGPNNDIAGRCVFNRVYNCELDATVCQSSASTTDGHGNIQISTGATDLVIHGNQIDTGIAGIGAISTSDNSDITISENVIRNCSTNAIDAALSTNSPANDVVIVANRFYNNGPVNVSISTSSTSFPQRWTIANNHFFETILTLVCVQEFSVHGNVFYSAGTSLILLTLDSGGGNGQQLANGIVARNRFAGSATALKITGGGATNVVIDGNYFKGQNLGGILTAGTLTDVAIRNNMILSDANASGTNYTAISTVGGTEISSNTVDITGGGTHCIAASGTTTFRNNTLKGAGFFPIVISGGSNSLVENNTLDHTISDSGTNTRKRGNTVSTGAVSGKATLVAGTVTVSTAEVQTGDTIVLSNVLAGGTLGDLSIGTIVSGTSFVINSSSGTDTSTVYWEIRH